MSNEERKDYPVEPAGQGPTPSEPANSESWTLDSAPVPETPEERLARDLNQTSDDMTSRLNDLQDELGGTEPTMPRGMMKEGDPSLPTISEPVAGQETPVPPFTPAAAVIPPVSGPAGGPPPTTPRAPLEGSDDDRLLSALAWLSMVILQLPVVGVIQLLSSTNRERVFQRHHAVTSLLFYAAAVVYEIIATVAFTILTIVTAGCGAICLWVIFFVPHALALYYAYQAYMGKRVELPVLSDFGRKQGWM